jgi:SAM-dependent methyltransferase
MLSKEAIQPIQPKTDKTTSIFDRFGIELTPMDLFQDLIHNPYLPEKGWHFGTGDPEFWKFSSKLIVPGGKALDLGSGLGRTSMPFALQGMEVTVYETNPTWVKAMGAVVGNFDLPISVLNEDIITADFGQNIYDTVILGQTFAHFESREEAFKVIKKVIDAIKPGGHIWFRGNGKGDPEANTREDFYMHTCDCSGEMKMEPHLFFDPLELVRHLSKKGISIVHMQMGEMVTVPNKPKEEPKNRPDIMYGEDWDPNREYFGETVSKEDLFGESIKGHQRTDDIITIIGQKN